MRMSVGVSITQEGSMCLYIAPPIRTVSTGAFGKVYLLRLHQQMIALD